MVGLELANAKENGSNRRNNTLVSRVDILMGYTYEVSYERKLHVVAEEHKSQEEQEVLVCVLF